MVPMWAWLQRQSFLIGMAIAIGAGVVGAEWFAKGGTLHLDRIQGGLIAAIFLISGLVLPATALWSAGRRLRVHASLQIFILVVLPAAAWAIMATGLFASWPDSLRSGLLILACLPTTITSCVVLTRAAGGNEALAVIAAATGGVLGVMVCPWTILLLTGVRPDAPMLHVVGDLALHVLVPLAVGQLIRWRHTAWCERRRSTLSRWSNWCFLVILLHVVATTVASSANSIDARTLGLTLAAVTGAFFCALLGATLLARWSWLGLDHAGQIALRFCGSNKSAAIGVPLIGVLAAGRADLGILCLPVICYHVLQIIVGGILAERWRQSSAAPLSPPARIT